MNAKTYHPALYWFTVATAVATFLLLGLGGLVTSHEAGMSVPDWPNTYGYNMFAFPVSKWIGGIFYEHTHRLLASGVGLLTAILAVWLWCRDTRRWMRWLGVLAFVLVALQGVLGGLRVTLAMGQLGIVHGALAQSFFVLVCALALFTSRWWMVGGAGNIEHPTFNIQHSTSNEGQEPSPHPDPLPSHQNGSGEGKASGQHSYSEARMASAGSGVQHPMKAEDRKRPPHQPSLRGYGPTGPSPLPQGGEGGEEPEPASGSGVQCANSSGNSLPVWRGEGVTAGALRMLALGTTILIFLQLVLGATMRHQHAGLAIPDFPLAYGKIWPDTSAAAVARYNADRIEVISVKPITAAQIVLQMVHRMVAVLILVGVAGVAWKVRRSGPPEGGTRNGLRGLAYAWLALIVAQIILGAATIWTNKAADVATAHVLVGALSLAAGALWCLIAFAPTVTAASQRQDWRPQGVPSIGAHPAMVGNK